MSFILNFIVCSSNYKISANCDARQEPIRLMIDIRLDEFNICLRAFFSNFLIILLSYF